MLLAALPGCLLIDDGVLPSEAATTPATSITFIGPDDAKATISRLDDATYAYRPHEASGAVGFAATVALWRVREDVYIGRLGGPDEGGGAGVYHWRGDRAAYWSCAVEAGAPVRALAATFGADVREGAVSTCRFSDREQLFAFAERLAEEPYAIAPAHWLKVTHMVE